MNAHRFTDALMMAICRREKPGQGVRSMTSTGKAVRQIVTIDEYRRLAGDRPTDIIDRLATQDEVEGFEPPRSGKLFHAAELL